MGRSSATSARMERAFPGRPRGARAGVRRASWRVCSRRHGTRRVGAAPRRGVGARWIPPRFLITRPRRGPGAEIFRGDRDRAVSRGRGSRRARARRRGSFTRGRRARRPRGGEGCGHASGAKASRRAGTVGAKAARSGGARGARTRVGRNRFRDARRDGRGRDDHAFHPGTCLHAARGTRGTRGPRGTRGTRADAARRRKAGFELRSGSPRVQRGGTESPERAFARRAAPRVHRGPEVVAGS